MIEEVFLNCIGWKVGYAACAWKQVYGNSSSKHQSLKKQPLEKNNTLNIIEIEL